MREPAGDLAIVLHSHMPYVEGFGTYPFGEEWLFDAVVRSYLPVLEVARDLTMTVTPVLADQLEDDAAMDRLRDFLVETRLGGAERDVDQVPTDLRNATLAEVDRYRTSVELLERCAGRPLEAFREAAGRGVSLMASAATHAVLPLLASRQCVGMQIDTGIRSHRRRFGWDGGFWMPECAYAPGLETALAERGVEWFCVDQSRSEQPLDCLAPVATAAGPVGFTIDWDAVSWLWSLDGYPSDPAYLQFHSKSMQGSRIWRIGGGPYDPGAGRNTARRQAGEFVAAAAERLQRYRSERGRRGLLVFAIDTELLGHWWSEGPIWLREVLRLAKEGGLRLVNLEAALEDHPGEQRALQPSSWGENKDMRTWDAPAVADMAWAARRLELRLLRALGEGLNGTRAARAARELLAVQASDWAFLDGRGQAGDYPFQRATTHAQTMIEAIESPRPPDPRLRAMAPDLSLAPLLEP